MAESQEYVAFQRGPHGYALPMEMIREIVWLPLLSPAEDLPPAIIGTFERVGSVIPVLDLDCLQGRPARPCRTTDCVVITEHDDHLLGLLVDEIRDVVEGERLPTAWEASEAEGETPTPHPFAGEIERDGRLLAVLDLDGLRARIESTEHSCPAPDLQQLLPDDEDDRALMRERSREMLDRTADESSVSGRPYAIARLAGEALALPLAEVLEFAEPETVYRIPRAPAHILGNTNLRGEIVTVIDIRRALELPDDDPPGSRAMICQRTDGRAAILLDEVSTVIHIDPGKIHAQAGGVDDRRTKNSLTLGEIEHEGDILTVIDLRALLENPALEVDQR
ncbi:MAG: chemotaxis protein CheW [Pseudomonadota bacterium]